MAQVLVTGGAGFIGSHLVDALLSQGETVRILDDLSTGSRRNVEAALATGRAELIVDTVADPATAEAAARGCERIFHLAATVGVRRVLSDPIGGLANNVAGTSSILAAARRTKPGSLVLFSSSEVYGPTTEGPLHEDDPPRIGSPRVARWSYAAGKALGERLARRAYLDHGVPVTIIRCFNTCGPRQVGNEGMVIPTFLDQAAKGEPITVYGDGTQSRCFSFVGDVVRGVLTLSRTPAARGEVYNIGNDREVSILELAEAIREITGSRSPIRFVPYDEAYGPGFEEVPRRIPDLGKIQSTIGYAPRVGLEDLLRLTWRWLRETPGAPLPAFGLPGA
ncbi:MAG: NAD-dependent epimerase/dehydratase family protein [Candidatus Eisenbacteria bacterium]|nr:NAD-dependent epimerase/dehydratase family protein [Candidatus Eisenbacteria bacterium]